MGSTTAPFFCTSCGNEFLKWEGRCPACGDWNTLREAPATTGRGGRSGGDGSDRRSPRDAGPRPLRDAAGAEVPRRAVEPAELGRVLGGGLVPGSVVLLGGAPGIGKSTLLLQLAGRLEAAGHRTLYVSGEESAAQVQLRARRLGEGTDAVRFLAETDVDRIVEVAGSDPPALLCVDSIQTLFTADVDSAAGAVPQVRECAARLQGFAKRTQTPTILVGHVTKGGGLAGPRTLEHVVDVVLRFEGQRTLEHRIVRASKNRFGSIDELAVFRMTAAGLVGVANPSELFLADRPQRVSGSAVAVPLHGSRPLLAEVQALTGRSRYGSPQRVATGFPSRRLSMLLTVVERRAGVPVGESDVYVNVVGGLQLEDPAADLAVVAALVSVEADRPLPGSLAFVGEVGLGGEVRSVQRAERRLQEVARTGLAGAVVPEALADGLSAGDVEVRPVAHVRELRNLLEEA